MARCTIQSQCHFNTSNVTIQLSCSIALALAMFISIHLMLLFNAHCPRSGILRHHFNTSNVTIQLISDTIIRTTEGYFNTSNVTIQHSRSDTSIACLSISIHLMLLFNATI